MTPAAEAKGIRLAVQAPPNPPSCQTDASRVEQILVNLLGNAIQHSPERGEVRMTVGAQPGLVVFTVENEGPGIPATEAERIFDIYVTKKEGEATGVGLGLPLSRRLARLLGGELRTEPLPDRARFLLELPAADG
jgi:signal transduction histidine kinase